MDYCFRNDLLKKLNVLIKNQEDMIDSDNDALYEIEMEIEQIRERLGGIATEVKNYIYKIKGIKHKSRRLVNKTY